MLFKSLADIAAGLTALVVAVDKNREATEANTVQLKRIADGLIDPIVGIGVKPNAPTDRP